MTVRKMHQSNRAAWNEAAAHYAEDLEEHIAFLRGRFQFLRGRTASLLMRKE